MIVRLVSRAVGVAAMACLALIYSAQAQQRPSPTAALAQQLLELKGGLSAFDPAIEGVIVHHRGILLQINPTVTKDVDAAMELVRAEIEARRKELHQEVAVGYASVFTEQELKDMIAFYKTPLGRKMAENEPKAAEAFTKRAQVWIDNYATDVMSKMRAELKKRGHNEF